MAALLIPVDLGLNLRLRPAGSAVMGLPQYLQMLLKKSCDSFPSALRMPAQPRRDIGAP